MTTLQAVDWILSQPLEAPCILIGSLACAMAIPDTPMHCAQVHIQWQPQFHPLGSKERNMVCDYEQRKMVDDVPNAVRVYHSDTNARLWNQTPTVAISRDGSVITTPRKGDDFVLRNYVLVRELQYLRFAPLNMTLAYFPDASATAVDVERIREAAGTGVLVVVRVT